MSIILKALKKAEESETEPKSAAEAYTYKTKDKRLWGTIIAGLSVTILLVFVLLYGFQKRPFSKLSVKPVAAPSVPAPQPSAAGTDSAPEVIEGHDAKSLHKDAIKAIRTNNYPGAESILRKALLIKPDDAAMHNHLGLALKNQSRYREAVASYEKALKLMPDYYEAMNNLAVAYESLGQREKAKALYKNALALKPSYTEVHLNYALLLEAEGDIQEAESHYYTFLNLSSDDNLKRKVRERLKSLRR
ncbi:MAG: tetratricopeptide repeat protein [Nitrospirae bacterium]|nr:tetratricopeptide repeat protein [Nitrospirota bacterium]